MNDKKLRRFAVHKSQNHSGDTSGFCADNFLKIMSERLFAAILVVLLCVGSAFAQERVEISGVVTDADDGSPLIGVSVVVEGSFEETGSMIGTATGLDGDYSIQVPSNLNVLVFSSIGYLSQRIEINGRTTINVEMEVDVQTLDDVVVVGYGSQRRAEVTSSIATIDESNFQSGNINDSQQLLQGKVAGLTVARPGGDPNSDFTLRLRGLSTIGANTEPLVVVDGIVGADFNSIDPNDIESINVLKDASAAAIYGTRGANGVILITTKSGVGATESGISVRYTGQVSANVVANKLETLNADEYRAFPSRTDSNGDVVAPTDLGNSTDWFDEVTQTGVTQTHGLSIAGGNQTTNYRVSGNYRDIQAIQQGTGRQQLNGRLSLNHTALDSKLILNADFAVTSRDEDIGLGEVFRYAALFNPTAPVRNDDGTFFQQQAFDLFNPVAINEQSLLQAESNRLSMGLRAEYMFDDLIPGLSATAFYARQSFDRFYGEYYNRSALFRGLGKGMALREDFKSVNDLFEVTGSYSTTVDMVRLETVAGYSWQDFRDDTMFAEGGGFLSDDFSFNNLLAANDFNEGLGTVSSFRATNRLIGFFGRANFIIDDTYFLSGAVRREGSSRFGVDNQWGTFFAVSGGAEITNLVDVPEFQELKLRVSYGQTGQDAPFSGISKLRYGPGNSFLVDGSFRPSYGPVSNANPDLKWEVKKEINVGIDFAMLNNRLTGSLEYYQSNTEDLLLEIVVPVPPNQAPTRWENVGELSNKGFEAALNYMAFDNTDFKWSTGVVFSTNETILEKFSAGFETRSNVGAPGLNDTPMIRLQEGRPIGEIWGWKFSRIGPDGEWLFLDNDGNEKNSDEMTADDRQVIGNGIPDFELGWTNTFNYKNFDLNMFFRGAFGHDLVNTFNIFHQNPFFISSRNVMSSTLDIIELTEAPRFSSFQVEDASFLRLENITLGYNFSLPSNSPIRELRMYGTVNNVFTITNYSGIDPEVRFADPGPTDNAGRSEGADPLAPGIERRSNWFTQRSFVFGVQLGF